MSPARGGLSYLAIATIFLAVLGTMWAGSQYADGELLDREPPTELESQFRVAIWEAVTGDSDAGGRDTTVRVAAQDTAAELATGDYFANATAVGLDGDPPDSIAKTKGLCARTPVRLAVRDPRVTASGAAVPEPVARDVAERVARLLAEHGERTAFNRAGDYQQGVGVAVRDDAVYVVFRTCNLGY